MAEWRKVAKAFALGDGHVSQKEVNLLNYSQMGVFQKARWIFCMK